MPAAKGQLHAKWENTYSGYLYANIDFMLDVEISDDKSTLTCSVSNNNSTWHPGDATSYGFINFAGLIWYGAGFTAEKHYDQHQETWDEALQWMRQSSNGRIPDDIIWGIYCTDYSTHQPQGTISGRQTYTRQLTPDDFDTDGQIRNLTLVQVARRWYNWQGIPPYGINNAVLDIAATDSISITDIDWGYFPWATRHSTWRSCNNGGGIWKKTGNSWNKRKNSEHGNDTSYVLKNGNWAACPKL